MPSCSAMFLSVVVLEELEELELLLEELEEELEELLELELELLEELLPAGRKTRAGRPPPPPRRGR